MSRLTTWLAWLRRRDGRWLYLAMALAIVLPLVWPLGLPISERAEVRAVYDTIDRLPPGAAILLAADYDPAAQPELQPFVVALIELAFKKHLRVVALSTWPQAPPLVNEALEGAAARYGRHAGVDYANLGFMEGKLLVPNELADSLASAYPVDARGVKLSELPVLWGLGTLREFAVVVCVSSGSPGAAEWVPLLSARGIDNIVAAVASDLAPQLMPYLSSGQLKGLASGMAGAAQFEQLAGKRGAGSAGMEGQSLAHLLIIAGIVFVNLAFLLERRGKRA